MAQSQWRQGKHEVFFPFDQINRNNVRNLKIVWRRPAAADEFRKRRADLVVPGLFRSTPLMINGVLYASNGIGLVEAFDPATGKTLWIQEPPESTPEALTGSAARSIGYWRNGSEERILSVRPPYLVAIHPKTGELVQGFGNNGKVDLRLDLGAQPAPSTGRRRLLLSGMLLSSAPRLRITRTSRKARRATFAATMFEPASFDGSSESSSAKASLASRRGKTGRGNTRRRQCLDQSQCRRRMGYIYLPLTSPTSDMYGGHRLGNNLFSDSIVCIKAETGERVWHFQTVHHDLWDHDLPAAPVLGDINVNGKRIKAVAQVTREGFVLVFDRVTGQPVWPIEERPVPPLDHVRRTDFGDAAVSN